MKFQNNLLRKIKMELNQPAVLKNLMKSKHFPIEGDSVTQNWQFYVVRSSVFTGLVSIFNKASAELSFLLECVWNHLEN